MADLRPLVRTDWAAVAAIWAEGIAGGDATFELEPPSWERFDGSRHAGRLRLVAEEDGVVVGWAALAPVSSRPCYGGVAELGIYVSAAVAGRGIGTALLLRLLDEARAAGLWTVQASVFPENAASLALHRRAGFREVGRRERIARLAGAWRDTLLFELRL